MNAFGGFKERRGQGGGLLVLLREIQAVQSIKSERGAYRERERERSQADRKLKSG